MYRPQIKLAYIVVGQIEDEFKTETDYSHTYAINLKDYLLQISEITGVTVPEPADYALMAGIFSLCGILATKTRGK